MFGAALQFVSDTLGRKPIKVDYATNIQGYMVYPELVWLAKQAQKHYRIVEIGTYFGKSTRALGDNTPGIVATIDNFDGPQDIKLPSSLRNNVFELFIAGCGDLINEGKVRVLIQDHTAAGVDFSPDMVFLDGSHLYADIKRDIELWKPRIVKGGLLCGHDFTNIEDVRQAVSETVGKVKLAKSTSIWYVTI